MCLVKSKRDDDLGVYLLGVMIFADPYIYIIDQVVHHQQL